jgi:hypothetical protein
MVRRKEKRREEWIKVGFGGGVDIHSEFVVC